MTPSNIPDLAERLRARAIAAKRRGRVIAAAELFETAAALLALEGERDAAIKDVFRMASAELTAVRSREAAEAELAKVREERDAFFDKLRQLLCINSVLTALKADAPLWLEHAEKLIDDHNAALAEKTV